MKRIIILFYSALFSAFCFSSIAHSDTKQSATLYGNYVNSNFNYEIIIPLSWSKEELTLSDKHFMYSSKDANTEIKVKAFKSSDQDIEKTIHTKTWNLRKIDPTLHKIIETEKIEIKKNVVGKLLIFEYRSKKNDVLQRTLVTSNNGIVYVVECKSPRRSFYKFEDIFTTAMASFKYIQTGESQPKPEESSEESLEEDEKL